MAKQSTSWTEVQVYVDKIAGAARNIPAPPQPNDAWMEKVNEFNRLMESMGEHVRSLVETEDHERDRRAAL